MKIGKYNINIKNPSGMVLLIIIITTVVGYMLQSYDMFSSRGMMLVRITLYAMCFFVVFVIKEEIEINKIEDEKEKSKDIFDINKWINNEETMKTFSFLSLMIIYLFSIPKLGFIISTLIFPAAIMNRLGLKSIKQLIIIPIVLTAAVYLMFEVWLLIPLPKGIFGI